MKKQFLVNILLLVFLNALIKPFWVFGVDRSVQNLLGSNIYGLYFALFNFSVLFNVFLDFGITNFNNRSISQNPALVNTYFPRLIFTKFIFSLGYTVLCFLIAVLAGYPGSIMGLLGILVLNQVLASFLLFLRSNISGLQLFTTDSIISVVDRFLVIILCSLILWCRRLHYPMTIQTFAFLQTIAYTITCLLAAFIIFRHTGGINFRQTKLFSFSLIRKSLPYALLGLLMGIHNRIDAVLLERLHPAGANEAGIYAQSFRIFDAIGMVAVLFASLLLPMFSRLLAEKKDTRSLIYLSFSILFPLVFILITHLIGFADPLMHFLYPALSPDSVYVFILLMVSIIPVSMSYIFGTLLTANGNLKILNRIAAAALLLNIILNLILIPEFGAVGSAYSALFTQLFIFVLQIIICIRYFKILFKAGMVRSYSIFILLVCTMVFLTCHFFPASAIGCFVSVFLSLILTILLNIINLKELRNLVIAKNPGL